jgi:hypothetical protein
MGDLGGLVREIYVMLLHISVSVIAHGAEVPYLGS